MREVDEAVRQDEMANFFQRYGWPVAAAVVLGLSALGGYLWWHHNQTQLKDEWGEEFTVALDKVEHGDLAAGDKALQPLTQDASTGTSAAARLMRGGIALEKGQPDEAVKLFAAVAADQSAPKPFRDLATIRQVAAAFDTMPMDQAVTLLKPLAVPGNPWFGSAGELLGLAYMKQDKPELAGPIFAAISRDKETPESLRRRTRQLAGLLGVDAIDDPEKAVRDMAEGQ
ncbi:MAG TPA: tetratricopeptide repeat protein [Devosia sp.]|nr:tetratricopeptide repeat protein [Devosia sp.]